MHNDSMPAGTPPTDTDTASSYQLTAVICPINMKANCAKKEMMSAKFVLQQMRWIRFKNGWWRWDAGATHVHTVKAAAGDCM